MMNKAEKRAKEVEALALVYNSATYHMKAFEDEIDWNKDSKKSFLEDHPEIDTSYYDSNIEECEVKIEAIEKALEAIYKLM